MPSEDAKVHPFPPATVEPIPSPPDGTTDLELLHVPDSGANGAGKDPYATTMSHRGPRKQSIVDLSAGSYDHLPSDRQGSKRMSIKRAGTGQELIVEGIAEDLLHEVEHEKELIKKAGKNKPKLGRSFTIGQELAYVEAEQKRLKVNIMLDEEEEGLERSSTATEVEEIMVPIKHLHWRKDGIKAVLIAMVCLGALIVVCAWEPRRPRHDVHHVKMNKYQAHLTSPLYSVSSTQSITIPMDSDKPTAVLDIKIAVPCTGYCYGGDKHRRLSSSPSVLVGSVTWEVLATSVATGARVLKSGAVKLVKDYEAETFETVDPTDLGLRSDETLSVRLRTDSVAALGVLCDVVQLGELGRYRVLLSGILFLFAFGLILSEQINRCYATFIGAFSALFLVCCVYGTPSVATVMAMIDFGTLMLLCTMMMIVHILAVTGFFQWVAVRLASVAKGDAKVLFFVMSNAMGWMSCILPNVTCVMLIGPITISLCRQMNLDPVPFYLSQTICSTIGGTTTLIGDPPNLVIGHKLKLKFLDFIKYNGPLIFFILPLASFLLYLRFKDKVSGKVEINIEKMKRENRIIDEQQFLYAGTVFCFITVGLFLSPVHELRPAWLCVVGFFFMAMVISHHNIKHYLNAVEWDTLLFFANLFVFVECLAELGLIKAVGTALADTIKGVDEGARLEVAVILVLWVSTIGSAFLESLPYTTTMTYILADLRNSGDMGIPVEPLCWALSVGACVGGIGSIMGSSANLVSMAVSERYSPDNPIRGIDFLKYGFPTLLVITVVGTGYQLLVFCALKASGT